MFKLKENIVPTTEELYLFLQDIYYNGCANIKVFDLFYEKNNEEFYEKFFYSFSNLVKVIYNSKEYYDCNSEYIKFDDGVLYSCNKANYNNMLKNNKDWILTETLKLLNSGCIIYQKKHMNIFDIIIPSDELQGNFCNKEKNSQDKKDELQDIIDKMEQLAEDVQQLILYTLERKYNEHTTHQKSN